MTNNRMNLVLLLMLLWAGQSSQYSCNGTQNCECVKEPPSKYTLFCPEGTSAELVIAVEDKGAASVKCSSMVTWSDLKMNFSDQVEDVESFLFERCSLPNSNLHKITQMIGVQPTYKLRFESFQNLSSTLERRHLSGFPKVKVLSLSSNGLTKLPADLLMDFTELRTLLLRENNVELPIEFFNNVPKLEWLELGNNHLKQIDPMLFQSLKKLTFLALFRNDLTDLDKDVFFGLDALAVLDISQNKLANVSSEALQFVGNLSRLHMSGNNFSSLPEGLLSKNLNLTAIRFNDNRRNLSTLPNRFLSNLPKLKEVELKNLKLEVLPEDIFWGSSSITSINLSTNGLSTLPKNIFNESKSLEELNLSSNRLSNLPEGIFQELSKLKKLELQNNQLTSISASLFKGLSGLIELNLEHNGLRSIAPNSFSYMEALQIARLSHNQLQLTEGYTVSSISGTQKLRELYLAHNNISEIFWDWMISMLHLTKLDLKYNHLSAIVTDDLQFLQQNIVVDITHNDIRNINLTFAELMAMSQPENQATRNVQILIEENPIVCGCNLFDFLKYLEGDMHPNVQKLFHIRPGNLKCYGPQEMLDISVSNLSYKTLQCLKSECPESCTCRYREYDSTVIADCSYKNLRTAPERVLSKENDKVELDLTGNFLTEVPLINQSGLGNIVKLLLSHNNISSISPDNIPPSLEVLELHKNNLMKVNSTVLERLDKSKSLKNLTLHGNPWKCDCEAKDLLKFIQSKYKKISNLVNVTCYNNDQTISAMTPDDLCPVPIGTIVALSVGIAVIGLVIGILAALYYRYEAEIKVWLYAHQMCLRFVTEEELDKDKLFDAFISFSHKDEDFVVNKLVSKLEEGPKPFKLCLHFRDWVAGEWIPTQIARSVEDSRRTIVILSPNFLESVWGRMEFRAAHSQALSEGRARVIVILYGDVGPTDQLDPELKAYLSMNTYVQWGDPLFWDKLRYALPHKPRVAQSNAQRIFESHQHHIKMNNGDKNELIYPTGVPQTPPAASTPPADTLKTFTSNGSLDKGVLITDCLSKGLTNYNNPNINSDRNEAVNREWENNMINRECTAM